MATSSNSTSIDASSNSANLIALTNFGDVVTSSNSGNGTNTSYTPIGKLTQFKENCKLKVLIQRLWNVPKQGTTVSYGLDMILMDEKGAQIQASVLPNDVCNFKDELRENQVICLDNVYVEKKDMSYCPLPNPYKLKFKTNTCVTLLDNTIPFPKMSFTLTKFNQMSQKIDRTDPLTDVIGLVYKVDNATSQLTKKGGSMKQDLQLLNESGDLFRVTFWGDIIEQLHQIDLSKQLCVVNPSASDKQVMVITSTVVKKFNNKLCLQTTFASKIYVNPNLPEMELLMNSEGKAHLKRTTEDVNTTLSETMELLEKATQPFTVFCDATISKVFDLEGFYFNACHCKKSLQRKNSGYWCYDCKEIIEDPEMRMKIHFEIDDGTLTKGVTAFDEQATFLLNKPLDDMLSLSYQGNGEALVKEALEELVGKNQDFELRISPFCLTHPESSFIATSVYESNTGSCKRRKID